MTGPPSDAWVEHRRLLFTVAYDVLGSVADAEDVVQETWLRWTKADRSDVADPRAYLVRVATTQALNRARSNASRRESYVGPWLPEPLIGPDHADAVVDRAAREQDVSLAMLVVLESLNPNERAVFVLREVFGMGYDEVATALDRTPANVRQLAHRAREHVRARRPRFETDVDGRRRATEQFLRASVTGDLTALLALLAPDVVLVSDAGGQARAPRRDIVGAAKVARFLVGIGQDAARFDVVPVRVNDGPGVVAYRDGRAAYVMQLELVAGRVARVLILANPDKLVHITR